MNKKIFVLLVVIMVIFAMSIPALAGKPENNALGEWCYELTDGTDVKVAGSNEFTLDFNSISEWDGTFKGDSVDTGWIVMQTHRWFFNSTVSFESVEVLGRTGSLQMRVNGWLPVEDPLDYSLYEGTWVITRATGDLRGLTGRGSWDFSGTAGCPVFGVPYEGIVRFKNE